MQVYTALPTQKLLERCAVSIGTFDGVHRGHRHLIETLQREAALRHLPTAVFTFQDMPYCYFRPDDCPRLLTLPDEKTALFEQLGVEHLFIVPFEREIADQSYGFFVRELLCRQLGAELLVAGPDFALGKKRAGDVMALRALGEQCGYELKVLETKLLHEAAPISSTRVRGAVEQGAVEEAAAMLGAPFTLAGQVVEGKKLGRTIGVPTINFQLHPRKVLPAHGIYAARAFFDDDARTVYPAALSIGTNPTVTEDASVKLEFHVIGQEIAAPPQRVRIEPVSWLRSEEKFDTLEALVAQMKTDIARAGELLGN